MNKWLINGLSYNEASALDALFLSETRRERFSDFKV